MDKLTGYSAEEAIGKSLVSFMSEEERGSINNVAIEYASFQ